MKRYDSLKAKIKKLEKAIAGSVAPYMAYLDTIENGYELRICFWDGKEGSGDRMPKPLVYQFSDFISAEEFLMNYLNEHKPMSGFVTFANESLLED